jgi:hypothetical protein
MNPLRPSLIPAALVVTFASLQGTSSAQCPFDPTVVPANLILCPNTQDSLSTQVYDSYQWYKAGAPLVGETGATLLVDAYNDAAYHFSVEATLDGCTEMSPEVLVDGWAFLSPTVMTTGAEPLYFTQNGPVYCGLDTVLLVMMQPYDINIQWTDGGNPIPGATDDTLVVTSQGQYSASGAPSICPDFVQQLGVWVDVFFTPPTQPVIIVSPEQICATPAGLTYQWYLDGVLLDGIDTECIDASQPGIYTVDVTYEVDCSVPSDGFLVTGIGEMPHRADLHVSPVPARDQLTVTSSDGTSIGQWRLLDATGRTVLQGDGLKRSSVTVDVSALGTGPYWLKTDDHIAVPVSVAR